MPVGGTSIRAQMPIGGTSIRVLIKFLFDFQGYISEYRAPRRQNRGTLIHLSSDEVSLAPLVHLKRRYSHFKFNNSFNPNQIDSLANQILNSNKNFNILFRVMAHTLKPAKVQEAPDGHTA